MNIEFQERPIDRQAALFFCRGVQDADGEVLRTVLSLLSQAVGNGDSCLELASIAGAEVTLSAERRVMLPEYDELCHLLQNLPTVGIPGEYCPIVIDSTGRLYLFRYWQYEHLLARKVLDSVSSMTDGLDEKRLQEGLERLFPQVAEAAENRQRLAAEIALRRKLCIISGGPGTGKSSTVIRILALIIEQPEGDLHRIAIAAPTGKAAARLQSSVSTMRAELAVSNETRAAIPATAMTIHRLLGTRRGSNRFRHDKTNPLPYDTVVVDEASMIDLPLMSALFSALAPGTRVILLGDRDQLASVEAGAVLGDICQAAEDDPTSPLASSVVELNRNYRFDSGSGIAALSRAVNAGDDREALRLLGDQTNDTIALEPTPKRETIKKRLAVPVLQGFRPCLEAETPEEALRLFDRFRILCALREGPWGAAGVNNAVETLLHEAGLIRTDTQFYRGRPVLITENDYTHKLFNGDTGIILNDPATGNLRAFFAASDGTVRAIPPEFLPKHETAFAMTIHKSQGSEFDRVLMVLPPKDNTLLTKELIYTGITRAKQSVTIWSDESVFSAAVKRRTERRSGLREMLKFTGT